MPELYRKAAGRLLNIHHFGVVGEDEELSVPISGNISNVNYDIFCLVTISPVLIITITHYLVKHL